MSYRKFLTKKEALIQNQLTLRRKVITGIVRARSVIQSYPILCDPMDGSLPSSSVHSILQTRMLDWVAMPSRTYSRPRDRTHVSCIAGGFFTTEPQGKPNNWP